MLSFGTRRPLPHPGVLRWLLGLTILLAAGCALPSLDGRPATTVLKETADTRLARNTAPLVQAHPEKTGIYPLSVAEDAFAARVLLAAAAQKSIDAQYYIWHDDVTGNLLFEALCQAAERGVRVRLLLDDNSTAGLDRKIAALAARPNISVRLFNPLAVRGMRWTNYLFDFSRLNHRMHNKSFTVDNRVTVVGGRNVGDEYFDAGSGVAFADLDVMALGPIVEKVSSAFDLYWNSADAYPSEGIVGAGTEKDTALLANGFAHTRANSRAQKYVESLRQSALITGLIQGVLPLEWADVQLVYDEPSKVRGAGGDVLLLPRLLEAVGAPRTQMDLVTPYFVPMEEGTESFKQLVQRGVRVRILTNSLESNDVAAVHAGYAKRRKSLLAGGVELYELRRAALPAQHSNTGGSSAALHAKTFQIDDSRVFVGSFNFDPRSAKLNTEMGFVIDSPVLAGRIRAFFDTQLLQVSYKVELRGGDLEWIENSGDNPRVYSSEPNSSAFRRGTVKVVSWLPIDWLL